MAEETKSRNRIAQEWLEYTILDWQKEIKRLRIGDTNDLYTSFHGQVVSAAGADTLKIALAYAWYGQMVDMGVGRGTKSGGQKENAAMRRILGKDAGHDRKPKPWYTKSRKRNIGYQTKRLAELIGAATATEAVRRSFEGINLQHIITLD